MDKREEQPNQQNICKTSHKHPESAIKRVDELAGATKGRSGYCLIMAVQQRQEDLSVRIVSRSIISAVQE